MTNLDDAGKNTIKIAVIANADWFAQGIASFLETTLPNGTVVGLTRFETVDRLVTQGWADLLTVGVPTRHDDHVMLLAGVRHKWPNLDVMMVGSDHFSEIVANARAYGATGYITTGCEPMAIARAIKATCRGEPFFPEDVPDTPSQAALPHVPDDIDARLARLTRRERQVMEHLGRGYANREIAAALNLREGTVRIYVHRVIRQLGLRNRVDVALCANSLDRGGRRSSA